MPTCSHSQHITVCDKSSGCYAFGHPTRSCVTCSEKGGNMRTVWTQSAHIYSFYFNCFQKHYLTHLRLWLRLGLGLKYMAGTCVTGWSVILLDYIHNRARVIGTRKVTFSVPMGRLGMWQIVGYVTRWEWDCSLIYLSWMWRVNSHSHINFIIALDKVCLKIHLEICFL